MEILKQQATDIIRQALSQGASSLSEREAKLVLSAFGVSVTEEELATTPDQAAAIAAKIGYPVACKGCGRNLLHKTEAGLVELGLTDESLVRKSFEALWAKLPAGAEGVLVSKMVKGSREFIAGVAQDPQFGPVVMFGLGGIFAEAISDVVFRVVPILAVDAMEMMSDIKAHKLLGPIRGMPAVDKEALVNVLLGLSEAAATIPQIKEIDINPLLIVGDCPIAVDALIKLAG